MVFLSGLGTVFEKVGCREKVLEEVDGWRNGAQFGSEEEAAECALSVQFCGFEVRGR